MRYTEDNEIVLIFKLFEKYFILLSAQKAFVETSKIKPLFQNSL